MITEKAGQIGAKYSIWDQEWEDNEIRMYMEAAMERGKWHWEGKQKKSSFRNGARTLQSDHANYNLN